MSLLLATLRRITVWLENNNPHCLSKLNPGLSNREIDAITKNWSIQIPPEVRELYQWKNGCGDGSITYENAGIFDIWGFLPLEKVSIKKESGLNEDEEKFDINYAFNALEMFFSDEWFYKGYVIIDPGGKTNWLEFGCLVDGARQPLDGARHIFSYYISLTSMMLTIAELYESYESVHYLNAHGYRCLEQSKISAIWEKYNHYIVPEKTISEIYEQPSFTSVTCLVTDWIKFHNPQKRQVLLQLLEAVYIKSENNSIKMLVEKVVKKNLQYLKH